MESRLMSGENCVRRSALLHPLGSAAWPAWVSASGDFSDILRVFHARPQTLKLELYYTQDQ